MRRKAHEPHRQVVRLRQTSVAGAVLGRAPRHHPDGRQDRLLRPRVPGVCPRVQRGELRHRRATPPEAAALPCAVLTDVFTALAAAGQSRSRFSVRDPAADRLHRHHSECHDVRADMYVSPAAAGFMACSVRPGRHVKDYPRPACSAWGPACCRRCSRAAMCCCTRRRASCCSASGSVSRSQLLLQAVRQQGRLLSCEDRRWSEGCRPDCYSGVQPSPALAASYGSRRPRDSTVCKHFCGLV